MRAVTKYEKEGDKTKVFARNFMTGKTNSLVVSMAVEEFEKAVHAYNLGAMIQKCCHKLSPDEREFLMTGLSPEQWDKMFPNE